MGTHCCCTKKIEIDAKEIFPLAFKNTKEKKMKEYKEMKTVFKRLSSQKITLSSIPKKVLQEEESYKELQDLVVSVVENKKGKIEKIG